MTPHRQNDIHKHSVIKRVLIYGAMFFILSVAQCSFFTGLRFIPAIPNIVLGAVAAISLLDSQRASAVCGIAAGFLSDALGGSGISLSPVTLLIVALVCSEIAKKLIPNFLTWVAVLIPASLIGSAFTAANIFLFIGKIGVSTLFKSILLPEFLMTVLFSLPVFFIARLCVRMADSKGKFKI